MNEKEKRREKPEQSKDRDEMVMMQEKAEAD